MTCFVRDAGCRGCKIRHRPAVSTLGFARRYRETSPVKAACSWCGFLAWGRSNAHTPSGVIRPQPIVPIAATTAAAARRYSRRSIYCWQPRADLRVRAASHGAIAPPGLTFIAYCVKTVCSLKARAAPSSAITRTSDARWRVTMLLASSIAASF